MQRAIFGFIAVALIINVAGQATAGVVTYSDETTFNAATSGLSTQTFGAVAATLGVGPLGLQVDNPLDNGTNGILLGLTITATSSKGGDIAVIPPNFLGTGLTNFSVFSEYAAGLLFTFSPGVTAASLDVLSLGVGSPANVTISIFDTFSNSLGTFPVAGAPNTGAGEFFGVTSNAGDVIGSLLITGPDGIFVGADQVQFGSTGASVVPEPSTFVMSSILFGVFGAVWSYGRLKPTTAA